MWHFNTISRIAEIQPRIAFVSAFDSQWREVAELGIRNKFVLMVLIIRGNRYSVAGIEIGLRVGRPRVRILAGTKCIFLIQNGQVGFGVYGAQTDFSLMSTKVLFRWQITGSMTLTIHLQ